ncbi:MAG: tetratricopeptide repeat protein [Actinomycetota bacterium]
MRRTSKVTVGLFVAALAIAGAGLVSNETRSAPAAANRPATRSELVEPVSVAGMKTTDEIIELWASRSARQPADYLSRTSLGYVLLTKARESGDLTKYEDAEAVFREALALNPKHPSALLGLGSARAASHDFAAQRDLAQQVLLVRPDSASALAALGDASLELGDYQSAEATYRKLERVERTPPVVSRVARLAHLRGHSAQAIALIEEAVAEAGRLDLPPATRTALLFQLGHHRYEAGDVAGAAAALERGLTIDPTHLGSLELLAQVRVAQERVDDAIAIYEDLIERGPAADLHGSVAVLYEATGDDAAAARHLEAGLALGRETIGRFPAERRHLAAFFSRHEPALALELAGDDIATRQDVHAYDTLAWALYRNGRYDEAAAAARQALSVGTQEVELLYHAGMIEAALGHDGEARQLLGRALALNPRFDVVDASLARETLAKLSYG